MIVLTHTLFKVKFLLLVLAAALLSACHNDEKHGSTGKVHIRKNKEKYTLYKDGRPFMMKGASGFSHYKTLSACGGNTIRTWDTTHLQSILDSAAVNHLSVIVGLPVSNNNERSFYSDPKKVASQQQAFKVLVNKYKHNPAILMWCAGNELDFPYGISYNSFYKAFNDLTDMIHQDDPDHPVTTTILNFNPKYIINILLRCNLDLISFNIFGRLNLLRRDLKYLSWIWNGPYMLLEWGISGPWQGTAQTLWGAYIEDTSTKKAEIYRQRYQHDMPVEDPRFLGASVFFWGNKQETTHTWFSMFDQTVAASQAVGTMQCLWTGKETDVKYPQIRYMLLNQKGAKDNIILDPDASCSAEVLMRTASADIREVSWQVFREDWYKENNQNSTKSLTPLMGRTHAGNDLKISFTAPAQEGPYRLFATVYNQDGSFATCNTPFYVVANP